MIHISTRYNFFIGSAVEVEHLGSRLSMLGQIIQNNNSMRLNLNNIIKNEFF